MTLEEDVNALASREQLVDFVSRLAEDFEINGSDWPNSQLGEFLEALAGWTRDMDGYFAKLGKPVPEVPSWQLVGQMLLAARVYE